MDRNTYNFHFLNQTRLVILGLSTICLTLLLSNSIALNFTIICMTKESLDSNMSKKREKFVN